MKTISLQQTYDLFDRNPAIRVENHYMDYAAMNTKGILDKDDSQFMFISWTDYDGRVFDISFLERNNKVVNYDDDFIYLKDSEEREVSIQILQTVKINSLL